MPRLRVDLGYDGSLFHGWAAQPGLRTVEGEVTAALETILRRPVKLTVAGRTDAGVHARHQVAHLDVEPDEVPKITPRRIQGLLARQYSQLWHSIPVPGPAGAQSRVGACDVYVHAVTTVASAFDARFAAVGRTYCYRIADYQSQIDPINRTNIWWQPHLQLDMGQLRAAAALLLGEHDFLSFSRPREGATTVRELTQMYFRRESELQIWVSADAFCHSMVRSLVGALVDVGRGRRDPTWVGELLANPSRSHGVHVAPAQGLTLENVDYPEEEKWSARVHQSRNVREGAHIF